MSPAGNNEERKMKTIHVGKKYTKIDVGGSGKYMIVNDTGEIYGIKAYGVIHIGHKYGTLDTIHNFYWGEYTGIRRERNEKNTSNVR
jgi:hypothetical protein